MDQNRNILLKVPAMLYGVGVSLRNFAFDNGWLKSYHPSIPTICVGNLSVGGTGKTPHIEMLIRLLRREHRRLAVVSRGYGRSSDGLIRATVKHSPKEIGDEPAQILMKFPDLIMMIDGDRVRAIKAIEALPPEERPSVILMDDGFQHRYVKPAYSILLTPFEHPFSEDYLMPYGNLREHRSGKYRADTVIATGTPRNLKPIDFRLFEGQLGLVAHQDLYFSRIAYGKPYPILSTDVPRPLSVDIPLLVISGIANPTNYQNHLKANYSQVREFMIYRDHYDYTPADMHELVDRLKEDKLLHIVCTEKDAVKILALKEHIPEIYHERFYALPIHIDISPEATRRLMSKAHSAIRNNGLSLSKSPRNPGER